MPQQLKDYRTLDVLCVLASEFFHLDDLEAVPLLLSGFHSVTATMDDRAARAVEVARLTGLRGTSRSVIKSLFDARPAKSGDLFHIDKATLRFTRRSGVDVDIARITECLSAMPGRAASDVDYADPAKAFDIELKHGVRYTIRLDPEIATAMVPAMHPAEPRQPAGTVSITFDELLAAAREMDSLDAAEGRASLQWYERLASGETGEPLLQLLEPATSGDLTSAGQIELEGVKHVLGLPGTGKTTLICLMGFIAARRGLRFAIFTTSVVVGDDLRRTLRRYGIGAEILYGSSARTKRSHALNYANLVAAEYGNNGFGHVTESAGRFAMGCALEGYVEPGRFDQIRENDPPCFSITQLNGKKEVKDLTCPLIALCGRHAASRGLVDAQAWIGHLSVLDTPVPKYLSPQKMTYAELVARQMDIVFIDEADSAQRTLDEKGIDRFTLSGSVDSGFVKLASRMATNSRSGEVEWGNATNARLTHACSTVSAHINSLEQYLKLSEGRPPHQNISNLIDRGLLNTTSIMASLFSIFRGRARLPEDDFFRIGNDLETSLRTVFFYDESRADGPSPAFLNEAKAFAGTHYNDLALDALDAITARFIDLMDLADTTDDDRKSVFDHVQILCHVVSCIVHVDIIVRLLPHSATSDDDTADLMRSNIVKKDIMAHLAEAVVGRVSGLKVEFERHPVDQTIKRINIDFELYRGTPRLLPYRLVKLSGEERGPNVVLLSATSFIPKSKTFHLMQEPNYVLARTNRETASKYAFTFAPAVDPNSGRPITVSGAGAARLGNLKSIINANFNQATRRYSAWMEKHDEERKIAIVVNSYDQVEMVLAELQRCNPALRTRARGVVKTLEGSRSSANGFHTAAEASLLSKNHADWDLLVFPAAAFGRGVNLVFPSGHRLEKKALIGTMVFPIRPHPSLDDPTFLQGKLASLSEGFDAFVFRPGTDVGGMVGKHQEVRRRAMHTIRSVYSLTGSPLAQASKDDAESFASNILVDLGQVMGRAIRGGVDAHIVFLDAAWAPMTAAGAKDTNRSSLLLQIAHVIEETMVGGDPVASELMSELYGNILSAIRQMPLAKTAETKMEAV
jgi:hypothetical protein